MSRAAAVREFVDQLFPKNDNDSDLVYEIAVADGRSYDPMLVKEFYDVLTDSIGYDGIIAEWKHKDGTSNVYVIFNSEQAKLTDNQNPTDNPDVRYSISQNAEADIDDVLNNKIQTEDIQLTDSSPSIILGQKGVRNLPMLMKASHIRENILTESEMKSRGFAVDKHTLSRFGERTVP